MGVRVEGCGDVDSEWTSDLFSSFQLEKEVGPVFRLQFRYTFEIPEHEWPSARCLITERETRKVSLKRFGSFSQSTLSRAAHCLSVGGSIFSTKSLSAIVHLRIELY